MKNLLLLIFTIISFSSFSQNIRFEGIIQDSNKEPLEMANVMAMNQDTKAMDSYAITNDKGKFVLNLKANATYTVKLSYLGMQNKEITITTETEAIVKNITMESGGIDLKGVEIVREMPVSISGDTIIYNADSFKNGTERKLEDVLKKLPGVQVNADGEIEVEGKKVTKLMVEGKDFFDGDTKLGVKNIPADAIDKIQVLRNFNENSILKGVENNQDNLAMNIKLKDGKKNFWFGDINAGGGMDDKGKFDRFVINPKLFYYSPKYSINVISNFNNIGELPLTIQDYFKFTGGFKRMMKGGSSFNVSSNDLGLSLLRNNKAKEIDTKFGATNFSYNPSKTWTLSGFGIISSSVTDVETITNTNFLKPNSTEVAATENKSELELQNSRLGLVKLSSLYKPNANFQMDYDILSKFSKQDEKESLLRQVIDENNISTTENIFSNKKQDPITINQNLSFYYTPSAKHVFALEMQHMYQEEDPFYNANLLSQPFNLSGYISGQNRNDITQDRFVKTNKLDSKLDYYYMLTPKSNINVTLGSTYSYQNFNSRIFQILDNQTENELNAPENTNKVNYKFNDAFLGLHYKLLTGKFTLTPGFSIHNYWLNNVQLGAESKMNFSRILPDFLAIYQIKKAESLTYNFSLNNNFTDINRLAEGFVLNNYNSLSKGNRMLENSVQQSHSLRYFKYNMFNFENISAFVNYNRSDDAVKNRALFDNVNQISSPINSQFADESVLGALRYGRSFLKNYKASISANLSWSKYNNIQVDRITLQEILITNESFSQNYDLKASTNFKNLPNIELGYGYSVAQYPNETYYTDSPNVKLEYFFLKSFSFVSEYEYFHYYNKDKSVENEYDFLSASLIFQKTKDSHFEYKVSVTNLLNTKALKDNSFSQFSTSDSQYTIQPRYLIFTLKYNL